MNSDMFDGEVVTVNLPFPSGVDSYGATLYHYQPVAVDNVLVCPSQTQEVKGNLRPQGDLSRLTLYFPKSFDKDLRGATVILRGGRYAVQGQPMSYAYTPTGWNMVVDVQKVEG